MGRLYQERFDDRGEAGGGGGPEGEGGANRREGKVLTSKPFLKSSKLGLPQPLTAGECDCACTPPPVLGGGALNGERGVGRVSIPTRGHTLWYSLYIYVLCGTNRRRCRSRDKRRREEGRKRNPNSDRGSIMPCDEPSFKIRFIDLSLSLSLSLEISHIVSGIRGQQCGPKRYPGLV